MPAMLQPRLAAFLDENGLEPCTGEGQLILKRTFSAAGTNRQFINGSPTTLNILASLGEWLVDIHGPHDHQSLLHQARQLAILDAYGGLNPLRAKFGQLLRRKNSLETEKQALIVDERTFAQQLDLLRFQVNEIKAAKLQPDEEAQTPGGVPARQQRGPPPPAQPDRSRAAQPRMIIPSCSKPEFWDGPCRSCTRSIRAQRRSLLCRSSPWPPTMSFNGRRRPTPIASRSTRSATRSWKTGST